MVKKALFWLIVGFVIFYIATQPREAAGLVRVILGMIVELFSAIMVFFTALAG